MSQSTFDADHDNADLMLANYYGSAFIPEEPASGSEEVTTFEISYNGTKPTVKVGGSPKIFTAQLPEDNHFDVMWNLSDGINTYGGTYDNYTQIFGDYTVVVDDRRMTVKVANNYNLIGTILTISAECADGTTGTTQVEVVG